MAKLIISRSKEWQNKSRKFKLFIDGEQIDVINDGEIKEVNLNQGKHKIVFKVDWCSSPEMEFDFSNDKTQTIEVSGYKLMRWIYPIFLLIFGVFLMVKWIFNIYIDELMYVSIPVILILFYYLTLGRKKYLAVKEL
jgi:hypothetical protein